MLLSRNKLQNMILNINFKGYWRDVNKHGIPSTSGIYLVYACTYNSETDTVSLNNLIYIGQAENLNERIMTHTKRSEFLKQCGGEENLCYSVAEVPVIHLDMVENALVYAQKPPLNDRLKDRYSYSQAEFHLEGRCALMKHKDFTIR